MLFYLHYFIIVYNLIFFKSNMKSAVITTGGLGTRVLTFTKTNPKAMLPLYDVSPDNLSEPHLRPLLEIVFENLYDNGFRKFCFIVGTKTKSSILNHLTPDPKFISLLKKRNSSVDKRFILTLNRIYKKFDNSEIHWISQSTPMGFGHALLSAQKFVKNESFLLHAGDTYIENYDFLPKLIKLHEKNHASGTLVLQQKNDVKGYGLAQFKKINNVNQVTSVQEKPKLPKSKQVILPIYAFKPEIFDALNKTSKGYNNELQVTDGITTLLNWNKKILAFNFNKNKWFDIGTPKNYYNAFNLSYRKAIRTK